MRNERSFVPVDRIVYHHQGGVRMPRNRKCRRVCREPQNRVFLPEKENNTAVMLDVEGLEAVRLCDLEEMDQDSAAERMNVSRGTFQRILYDARKKIAEAVVCGKKLMIEGGNYEVTCCSKKNLCRHCRVQEDKNNESKL